MTKIRFFACCILIFGLRAAPAQNNTPAPSASVGATISAAPATSPSPTPTPTAPSSARSVRISFVPPPLEGSISLGVYDNTGKLVRALVREGDVDEFEVGADALIAKWDGRGDGGEDLPNGKYRARGYMVGRMKIQDMGKAKTPPDPAASDRITVKLMANALSKDAKTTADLAVALEDEQIVLKTADGLPLLSVIESPPLAHVLVSKSGEKAVDIWADGGSEIEQVRLSNVDQMMAFDCGEIELR